MENTLELGNNKIIKKLLLGFYPSSFISSLSITISFLLNSMMAGYFFTPNHIAAIGVVMPLTMLPLALLDMFASGSSVLISMSLGRNDKDKCNTVFSMGLLSSVVLSIIFYLALILFAKPLVFLYGARDPGFAEICIQYLRFQALIMIIMPFCRLSSCIHGAYGNHDLMMIGTLSSMVLSVTFSIILIKTTSLGIAALGLGAVIGMIPEVIFYIINLKVRKVPLKFTLKNASLGNVLDMVKHGFSSSTDRIIDSFIGGFVNNIIITSLGVAGIAILSVVKSITSLARTAFMALQMPSSALIGILYGARDKNALKRAFGEAYKIGILFTVIWSCLIFLAMPFLVSIYMKNGAGIENPLALIRQGVLIIVLFFPATMLVSILSSFFQSTERYPYALASSIIPDSVIYPITLALVLPSMGFLGLWISFGGYSLAYLVLFCAFLMIKNRKLKISSDEFLCINADLNENAPVLDISITSSNLGASRVSERINSFLLEHGASSRTAYMCSLCSEEITADFIEHARDSLSDSNQDKEFMDIKLFSDEDSFRIVIRNINKSYNPLDFEFDANTMRKIGVVMVQKVAKKIEYSFAFKINIINIEIANSQALT